MRKSQVSMEFIFAIGIIFFVFLIIFGFVINRDTELGETEGELNKRNTCLLISSLLTSAFVNGDGVIIDASIDYNATINITDSYRELEVEGSNCLLSVYYVPNAKLKKGVIRIENLNDYYIDVKNVQP